MDDAIGVIDENPNIPTTRVARDFDVPTRRLQRRVEKGRSRKTSTPNSMALTQAQELAIIKFIKLHDSFDMSIRLGVLREYADFILSESGSSRVIG